MDFETEWGDRNLPLIDSGTGWGDGNLPLVDFETEWGDRNLPLVDAGTGCDDENRASSRKTRASLIETGRSSSISSEGGLLRSTHIKSVSFNTCRGDTWWLVHGTDKQEHND